MFERPHTSVHGSSFSISGTGSAGLASSHALPLGVGTKHTTSFVASQPTRPLPRRLHETRGAAFLTAASAVGSAAPVLLSRGRQNSKEPSLSQALLWRTIGRWVLSPNDAELGLQPPTASSSPDASEGEAAE